MNASQLATLDRGRLDSTVGNVASAKLREIDQGLRLVLAL